MPKRPGVSRPKGKTPTKSPAKRLKKDTEEEEDPLDHSDGVPDFDEESSVDLDKDTFFLSEKTDTETGDQKRLRLAKEFLTKLEAEKSESDESLGELITKDAKKKHDSYIVPVAARLPSTVPPADITVRKGESSAHHQATSCP